MCKFMIFFLRTYGNIWLFCSAKRKKKKKKKKKKRRRKNKETEEPKKENEQETQPPPAAAVKPTVPKLPKVPKVWVHIYVSVLLFVSTYITLLCMVYFLPKLPMISDFQLIVTQTDDC